MRHFEASKEQKSPEPSLPLFPSILYAVILCQFFRAEVFTGTVPDREYLAKVACALLREADPTTFWHVILPLDHGSLSIVCFEPPIAFSLLAEQKNPL